MQQIAGGHEGAQRAVVHAAEPGGDDTAHPAEAIVAGILVEVGVETGGDRDAHAAGGGDGRGTERAFSGDVHEVRPVDPPEVDEPAAGGQADAELGIAGNGMPGRRTWRHGQALGHAETRRFVPLARADDGHAMAALGQAVHDAAQRHGDAVYFRSVSFSNEGKMQSSGRPGGGRDDRPSSGLKMPRKLCRIGDGRVTI